MSAVEEYQMRVTHLWTGHRASEEAAQIKLVADAAIAELEAALEHALSWPGLLEFIDETYPTDIFTGESGDPGPRFIVLLRELKKAESENERLKVCGTCAHCGDTAEDTNCHQSAVASFSPFYRPPFVVSPHDACHFKPSRWTPYWEADHD